MGKKSVKENKNIYQRSREAARLSREAAGERMVFVSPGRIERIESGRSAPHPDEVLSMEKCYRAPELSNYFCTHECPIGMKYEPEAKLRELPHTAMELLAAEIVEKLTRLETAIRAMRIWIEHDAAQE